MDDSQLAFRFNGGRTSPEPSRIYTARVRVELVRDAPPLPLTPLRNSADAYALLRDEAAVWDRERFISILLDNKHRLIGIEEISVGSLTQTVVAPREVFKAIILANAAAFMVLHNHPSGDPTPSQEDIAITRRLREGADLFGIRFLDHIVIGAGSLVMTCKASLGEARRYSQGTNSSAFSLAAAPFSPRRKGPIALSRY